MDILVHCCCGPCAVGALPQFIEAGYQPFGWFYNPNIQPWQEHKARKESFIRLMEEWGLTYEIDPAYPLEEWLRSVAPEPERRCEYCYRTRLSAAARQAAERGFSSYSTTLLISPYQNHELLGAMGREYGEQYGVDFVYLDLRPNFRAGQDEARKLGMYMQKYCGCIYSEKERYSKQVGK